VRVRVNAAWLVAVAVATVGVVAVSPAPGGATPNAARPKVTGPVTGGNGYPDLVTTNTDLAASGYERNEYFIGGTAMSYEPQSRLTNDGRWDMTPDDTAKYRTRIVVIRPIDPKDFSGTVFVEWFNVSAGFDTTPGWTAIHTQLMRRGDAYVGVDAQATGVQGGQEALPGATQGGIKAGDPARYSTLNHPGDAYSYDIFSQAGVVAAGLGRGVDPFSGYDVEHVIATGQSQSAYFLTSYIDGIHPIADVYDGFLVLSRGAAAAPFTDFTRRAREAMPQRVHIRNDLDVPVLTAETETDLTRLGFLPARQPDSKRFRLWEIAGSSHADQYTTKVGMVDTDDGSAELALLDPSKADGGVLRCTQPINAAGTYSVLNAAALHLAKWVEKGTAPPVAPRLATKGDRLVRDRRGIAQGGIRTPVVDVPIATNTGEINRGGRFCGLFGRIHTYDPSTLAGMYPSHDAYVRTFRRSADVAVRDGFWLQHDARQWVAAAGQLSTP
jgi:hypothetical protein